MIHGNIYYKHDTLGHCTILVSVCTLYFQPMLVQACFHGDPDEVRALLYKKEDVNYQVRLNLHLKNSKIGRIRPLVCFIIFLLQIGPCRHHLACGKSNKNTTFKRFMDLIKAAFCHL